MREASLVAVFLALVLYVVVVRPISSSLAGLSYNPVSLSAIPGGH